MRKGQEGREHISELKHVILNRMRASTLYSIISSSQPHMSTLIMPPEQAPRVKKNLTVKEKKLQERWNRLKDDTQRTDGKSMGETDVSQFITLIIPLGVQITLILTKILTNLVQQYDMLYAIINRTRNDAIYSRVWNQ